MELKDLQAALVNIEEARPLEDLTVRFELVHIHQVILIIPIKNEDVIKAYPRLRTTIETMVKKGKWTVPGESFFAFVIFGRSSVPIVQDTRRSSATFPLCKRRRAPHRFNRSRRRLTFLRRECMHDNVWLGAFRANSNHCSVLP